MLYLYIMLNIIKTFEKKIGTIFIITNLALIPFPFAGFLSILVFVLVVIAAMIGIEHRAWVIIISEGLLAVFSLLLFFVRRKSNGGSGVKSAFYIIVALIYIVLLFLNLFGPILYLPR